MLERGANKIVMLRDERILPINHREQGYIENVQVIGFDNVTLSLYSYPTLTTIHQATDKLGEQASELLLSLLERKEADSNRRIVIPVHLVERETTL